VIDPNSENGNCERAEKDESSGRSKMRSVAFNPPLKSINIKTTNIHYKIYRQITSSSNISSQYISISRKKLSKHATSKFSTTAYHRTSTLSVDGTNYSTSATMGANNPLRNYSILHVVKLLAWPKGQGDTNPRICILTRQGPFES
jgi:hypothetical protein